MKATGVLHDMTLRFSPLIRHSRCLQRVNPGPDQRFVAALSFFVLARSIFLLLLLLALLALLLTLLPPPVLVVTAACVAAHVDAEMLML